jgi:very-short-patch-repair endonuclease
MPHQTTIPILKKRAKSMRPNQTDAEAVLWNELRNRRLMGMKFRRQVPTGNFIVDFVCSKHKLIVEVDGTQHAENEYDQKRDTMLKAKGFVILRFWNDDVLKEINSVCDTIIAAVGLNK